MVRVKEQPQLRLPQTIQQLNGENSCFFSLPIAFIRALISKKIQFFAAVRCGFAITRILITIYAASGSVSTSRSVYECMWLCAKLSDWNFSVRSFERSHLLNNLNSNCLVDWIKNGIHPTHGLWAVFQFVFTGVADHVVFSCYVNLSFPGLD